MKKLLSLSFLLLFFVASILGNSDYEQVLQDRNLLYNQVQSAMRNDTVSPEERLQMWQSLILKDNQIIDEWIPAMQKQTDSLNVQLESLKTEFAQSKSEMQEKQDMLLYAGAGAAGLFLLFFILFIATSAGKSKTKKKLKAAIESVKEYDRLLEVHQNTKDLLDKADEKAELLKNTNQQLTAEADKQKTLLQEAEQKHASQMLQLQNEKDSLEKEISSFVPKLKEKQDEISEIHAQHQLVISEKEILITNLRSELEQLKSASKQNEGMVLSEEYERISKTLDFEREENLTRLQEKEILLEEFRQEIRELRAALDEKVRDDNQKEFTGVEDLHEEITRLKKINAEQGILIEEFRITLEKELEMRHEIEAMLKDFFQK